LAECDGHDLPGSVDKGIPGITAVIDDIVVGFEDAVRKPVVAHEFSTGFSSGDLDGRGTSVMFGGTGSVFETCQPA
jgi:hypothetical protein